MNDQIDHELETRLRSAYRTGELPAAPSRLLDALERVPDAIVVGRRAAGTRPAGRRASFGLLGIAAVLAVGGALAIGGGGLLRGIVPAPTPQLAPSAVPGTVITYAIQWSSETPSDPATVARLLQVIEDRVAATGAVGLTVRAAGEDRIVVGLPAGLDTAPFRQLIGQRGETTFVPLGTTALERGDPVDPATNSGVVRRRRDRRSVGRHGSERRASRGHRSDAGGDAAIRRLHRRPHLRVFRDRGRWPGAHGAGHPLRGPERRSPDLPGQHARWVSR